MYLSRKRSNKTPEIMGLRARRCQLMQSIKLHCVSIISSRRVSIFKMSSSACCKEIACCAFSGPRFSDGARKLKTSLTPFALLTWE